MSESDGGATGESVRVEPSSSWKLNVKEFKLPHYHHDHHHHHHHNRQPRSFTFSGLVRKPGNSKYSNPPFFLSSFSSSKDVSLCRCLTQTLCDNFQFCHFQKLLPVSMC